MPAPCVQVVGAPLAAGMLHLSGKGGLQGWQWLFIAEGVPTAALGLALPFLLPASVSKARWLSPAEAQTVQTEVDACRGDEASLSQGRVGALLRVAFAHRAMYALGLVKFAKDLTAYGLLFWVPILIRQLLHSHRTGSLDGCESWSSPADGAE